MPSSTDRPKRPVHQPSQVQVDWQHELAVRDNRITELEAEVEYLGRTKRELTAGLMQQIDTLAEEITELEGALRQTTELVLGEFRHPDSDPNAVYMGKLTADDIHLLRAANYEILSGEGE